MIGDRSYQKRKADASASVAKAPVLRINMKAPRKTAMFPNSSKKAGGLRPRWTLKAQITHFFTYVYRCNQYKISITSCLSSMYATSLRIHMLLQFQGAEKHHYYRPTRRFVMTLYTTKVRLQTLPKDIPTTKAIQPLTPFHTFSKRKSQKVCATLYPSSVSLAFLPVTLSLLRLHRLHH